MTLLCIEDDPDDRQLFLEAVRTISPYHSCLFANDGKHAFRILEQFLPDYIFLDINMPEMSGKDVLKELKKSTGLKTIPVIVLSTSTLDEDKTEFRKLGAVDFISKPSIFSELCSALKKYL